MAVLCSSSHLLEKRDKKEKKKRKREKEKNRQRKKENKSQNQRNLPDELSHHDSPKTPRD